MAKSRRNSYSNRRQRSDSSLIQSAGSMYRAKIPYQADPVGSFSRAFKSTYEDIQVKKDADYAKVELEMSEHLEEFGELKEFSNGLSSEKKAQITPWLRARRDELYDAKKRLHEAKPKERDSIRAEIDDIMSTVENSAKTNSDMITYFNSVAGAKLGNGNGVISPEKSKNTLQNMLGQDSTFNSKDGTWEYEKGMYQIAEEERVAIMENFSQGLKFGQDNVAAYPKKEERKNWRTSDQGILQKASFKNLLNENAVVSMLFDDHGFNDGGYFDATLQAFKKLENPTEEDIVKLKEYDDNLSKLKMGRGTEEYNQGIEYFREELSKKMMDQFDLSVQRGFNSVTSDDDEEKQNQVVPTGVAKYDEVNYYENNSLSPFTITDKDGIRTITEEELFDKNSSKNLIEIQNDLEDYGDPNLKNLKVKISKYKGPSSNTQPDVLGPPPPKVPYEFKDKTEDPLEGGIVITTSHQEMVADENDNPKMQTYSKTRYVSSIDKLIEIMNTQKEIFRGKNFKTQISSEKVVRQ